MQISYKAVYHLLDQYYLRRSLNGLIESSIMSEGVFKSSLLFAHAKEDYRYLDVMVSKRAQLERDYVFFTHPNGPQPIVLFKDRNLTLLEFAALFLKAEIPLVEFRTVVEAQAESKKIDTKNELSQFSAYIEALQKVKETAIDPQ